MQLRSISNKKKPSQLSSTTQALEKETKQMVTRLTTPQEEQLQQLKQIMQQEKHKREAEKPNGDHGTRWKAAKLEKGLRNYTQNLLQKKNSIEQVKKPKPTNPPLRPTSSKLQPLQNSVKQTIDKEVEIFLTQLGLLQYKDKFQNYTILTLKKSVTVQSLRDMGILPGHQIKIIRALKEIPENIEQMQEDSFCQSRVSVSASGVQCQQQQKMACWLCYKIFDGQDIQSNGRNFCSQQCLIQFTHEYMVNCYKCQRQFYKNDGCLVYDNYYCSMACSADANDSVKGCSTNTIESVIEDEQQQNYAEQFNEFLTSSLLNN